MRTFEEFCRQYDYDEKSDESKIAFAAYIKKIDEMESLKLVPDVK